MKHTISFILMGLSLYYAFIEPITIVYWAITIFYAIITIPILCFTLSIWSKQSYANFNKASLSSKQKFSNPINIIFTATNFTIITAVLVYTQNYYHLVYPFSLIAYVLTLILYPKQN